MKTTKIKFIDNNPIKGHNFFEPKDKNSNGFKFFQVSAFIGPMRCGKSLAIINLVKYLEENDLITETFLLSPTIENNPFHVLNIPEENIYFNLDNVNNDLENIIKYIKNKIKIWKNIRENLTKKEYENFYKLSLKKYKNQFKKTIKYKKCVIFDGDDDNIENNELNDDDIELLMDNKLNDIPTYYNSGPNFCIILDDILGSDVICNKKGNVLNKMIANHRHLRLNIYLAIQTFTNGIPKSLRRIIKQYYLWKFNDIGEIENFYKEIGSSIFSSFDEFIKIYREITNKPHNFLLLDSDPLKDNLKIRENFDTIITL